MIALEPHIAQQLRTALPAGWTVKGITEDGARNDYPFASVAIGNANPADPAKSAVSLAVLWIVTLVVRKGPDASAALDAALTATLAGLHGWAPGEVAGRKWERLRVQQITTPELDAPEGLAGLALAFQTAAKYDGHPDSY